MLDRAPPRLRGLLNDTTSKEHDRLMTTKHILREARVQLRRYRHRLNDELRRDIEADIEKLDAARKERRKDEAHKIAKTLLKEVRTHTPKTFWHHTIETVESFAIAIILALAIRHFFVEPFKIPTGSMEPTLHGSTKPGENPKRIGDFIMVSKFAYGPKIPFTNTRLWTVAPKRWDVVVFSTNGINSKDGEPAASDPPRNFVKRIVGLPGEEIEIRDGWIYANGEKADMPDDLRDRLISQKLAIQEERERRYGSAFSALQNPDAPYEPGMKSPPQLLRTRYRINVLGLHLLPFERRLVQTADEWPYGQPGQVFKVLEGHYFVLGDNTAESLDGRAWGFVPFENIKGRVLCVWYPVYRWRSVR